MDELLARLNSGSVRYLLIGGQALRLLGLPRFSMDWDFFIPPRDETQGEDGTVRGRFEELGNRGLSSNRRPTVGLRKATKTSSVV